MTIDEFFEAIKTAKPEEREALADKLLKELSPDERVLAESTVGDFIAALDDGNDIVNAPPGMEF
jgi:hypothetical protein